MHNLCVFCTFSTFAQKILKGWGWNFIWSFRKLMSSKSIMMVFMASIIRHKLCMIYALFYFFVQRSFLTKNYFLIAEINLTTWGPLYTCLVSVLLVILIRYWHTSPNIALRHLSFVVKEFSDFAMHLELNPKVWVV